MTSIATGFWAGWVVVLTIVSGAGLVWLTLSVYFGGDDSAEVGHVVWDETLREGTTAAPLWWFWMILALLATSVVYLILYPGFGSYAGVLRWSQGGQIAASLARHEERFGPLRTEIAAARVAGAATGRGRHALGFASLQQPLQRVPRPGRAGPGLAVPRSARRELAMGPR